MTLFVSKGPKVAAVPDVTSFSRADAIATLRNSGFKVLVEVVDTTDPSQDGVVLTQTPGPGESAKPGATITVTVGRYTAPPPPTTTQQVTTTDATTTATTTTPTTDQRHDARTTAVTPSARRAVAVIMGGRSSEHAISLASARSVIDALDPARFEVVPIEIGRDGRWALPRAL